MTFTQLQQYLQDYLETIDTKVISNIPNFMTLGLARISTELRGAVIEANQTLDALPEQPQPAGFLAATMLQHNTFISTYVSPKRFVELSDQSTDFQEYVYTLQSGQIKILPTPQGGDAITLSYYVAGSEAISQALPHLLLHVAAYEAEMFQGNVNDAGTEMQTYRADMASANGWDIQSGPISLGGAM